MKKADIFDRQHPRPLDRQVYTILKDMRALEKEVLKNWIQDVSSGRLGMRGFYDLSTARLEVKRNGEAAISLKPVVGETVHSAFILYTRFFMLYRMYNQAIGFILDEAITTREYARIHAKPKIWKAWREKNIPSVNIAITVVKILVLAMLDGTLTHDHLGVFEKVEQVLDGDDDTVRLIDQMVREVNLTHVLSDEFAEGGHFFYNPEPDLMNAYWRYEYRRYARKAKAVTTPDAPQQ